MFSTEIRHSFFNKQNSQRKVKRELFIQFLTLLFFPLPLRGQEFPLKRDDDDDDELFPYGDKRDDRGRQGRRTKAETQTIQ